VQGNHEEERLVGAEPARAQRMVSESRDLVARTLDAVAQSRKLLDRLRRKPSRKPAPGDDGASGRHGDRQVPGHDLAAPERTP
jgi:hypothetical protein